MNKKLLLICAVAVAGYFTLTAFGGQTKADQMADIQAKITMGLDQIRLEEQQKCDARVAEAVETKYAEMPAATPEMPAAAPSKTAKKGSKSSGPSVKPLPSTTAPAPDPVKTRGGAVQQGTEQVKERGGAVQQGTQDVKTRGGAVKQGGGGK